MSAPADGDDGIVSITPLLKRLWPSPAKEEVTAAEVAAAISEIFTNSLSPVQTGALLTALHFTGWDRRDDVIAKCAQAMRDAAAPIDLQALRKTVQGTGGDSHNTFNVSTTASIIASPLLLIGKHGNRASTSKSGSADLLTSLPTSTTAPGGQVTPSLRPDLSAITPTTLPQLYTHTNYGFLFAPQFHPGMRHVAPVRKQLGWRTIFNLLGPLSNPAHAALEARVIGVARLDLGPVFASALRMTGARKALVVCGEEELDEISCAGATRCWMLVDRRTAGEQREECAGEEDDDDADDASGADVDIEAFKLTPADFGLSSHPLAQVGPGKEPQENAEILLRILKGEMAPDEPVLQFVLMNAAALLVVSGVCEAETSAMGDGDDGKVILERGPGGGRWKEGVRRARWGIENGAAIAEWERFVRATEGLR